MWVSIGSEEYINLSHARSLLKNPDGTFALRWHNGDLMTISVKKAEVLQALDRQAQIDAGISTPIA